MAGIGSLSNNAINQLGTQQFGLLQTTTRLATGKQINTAADNPSGLAIYTALSTQAAGADQGSLNAQDALNATNVAQGATQTISDILQNVNNLSIQASSDFLSSTDRSALQASASQQIQQLNQIAGSTNFNGTQLLNGQFSGTTTATPPSAQVNNNDLLLSGSNVVNAGAPVTVAGGTPSETVQVSVSVGQAQVNVVNSATGAVTNVGSFAAGTNVTAGGVNFTLGNFSATDTGTATIQVNPGSAFAAGNPLTVQTGATQGATSNQVFPNVSAGNLGVSNIDFATTSNAENALGNIGNAISSLSLGQAQLGAQTISLQNQINANNTLSVNLTSSASNIADTNIPQTVSQNELLKAQSLITLNVLHNANTQAGFLSGLLNSAA